LLLLPAQPLEAVRATQKWQREKKQTSSNSVVAHELIERVV
jgi:hypothetical protein